MPSSLWNRFPHSNASIALAIVPFTATGCGGSINTTDSLNASHQLLGATRILYPQMRETVVKNGHKILEFPRGYPPL